MWYEIGIYCSATVLGISAGTITAVTVYARLVGRLRRRAETDATAADLEKRRQTHLSGRTDEVREHAGRSARIYTAFPVKPGRMAQKNLAEDVDTQRNTK